MLRQTFRRLPTQDQCIEWCAQQNQFMPPDMQWVPEPDDESEEEWIAWLELEPAPGGLEP